MARSSRARSASCRTLGACECEPFLEPGLEPGLEVGFAPLPEDERLPLGAAAAGESAAAAAEDEPHPIFSLLGLGASTEVMQAYR